MRVCVLQTVLDPYKGGNHLPLLAAATNVSFTILCNRSRVDAKDLPRNVSVVTVLGSIGPYYYGIADFQFARRVLATYPPSSPFWKTFDVIHCNQVMGLALQRLRGSGLPFLLLIHHPVTADREVAVAESRGWQALQWRMKYALLVRWQRQMCHAANKIATVSSSMQQRIGNDYGVAPDQIAIIPNGVDGSVFRPVPDPECTADVIAVGSFVHPRKGFRYLVDVYRRLSASGKSIADVGRRTDEQVAALKHISGVTIYGTVDGDKLVELVRHARVLVSTSLFEGFGLSLIEALACGHPAFAFDAGAVREVLSPIDPTLILPPGDTEEMHARVIAYLSRTPHEHDVFGAHLRKSVLKHYPLHRSAKALESLYRMLVP